MSVITITYGDQAENHVGMQKIGQAASEGFDLEDLQRAQQWFRSKGTECHIRKLNGLLPEGTEAHPAYILIANKGLDAICGADRYHQEQLALVPDTRAFMYGRVVNKIARYNLCFGDQAQEADYEHGKGTVVAFQDVPFLNQVRLAFEEILGEKGKGLVAEGNYYYDKAKCGIGYHGDSERRKVIGVRVGEPMSFHYQWYHDGKPIGENGHIEFQHGDIYIASTYATGFDWKCRSKVTLRHAAGCNKYTKV